MNIADAVALILILAMGVVGWQQGALSAISSLAGFTLGLVTATRVAHVLMPGDQADPAIAIWGVVIAVVSALVVSALVEHALIPVRNGVHDRRRAAVIDRVAGACAALVLAVALVWLAAGALMSTPSLRSMRGLVRESVIVGNISSVMPSPSFLLGVISRYDPLPELRGSSIVGVSAPDPRVAGLPALSRAQGSVVRVIGEACGFQLTGSGWVAAPDLVVTNAHVVAGEVETFVQPGGRGDGLAAVVVWFDADTDLALLRIPRLGLTPLPVRLAGAQSSTSAVIMGYPENGPFDVRPVRVGTTAAVITADISGTQQTRRDVMAFRGVVRHGNSGGPVLDESGAVIATVFAAAVGGTAGGYAIPVNEVRPIVAAGPTQPVSAGSCME